MFLHGTCAEVRGQLCEVSVRLQLLCGSWGPDSDFKARMPRTLPTKPPPCLHKYLIAKVFFFQFYLPIPYDMDVNHFTDLHGIIIPFTVAIIAVNRQLFQDKITIRKTFFGVAGEIP